MKSLERLFDRIVQRVNINLRELEFDVNPFVKNLISPNKMTKFYAFYGITPHHPLSLQFRHSNLAGSYFLGKCRVTNSLLYKSDIRGDELKKKGDLFQYHNFEIPVNRDEEIEIDDSFLIKTLVQDIFYCSVIMELKGECSSACHIRSFLPELSGQAYYPYACPVGLLGVLFS